MIILPHVKTLISLALDEDLGRGDWTALAIAPTEKSNARIIARSACVASGLWLVPLILEQAQADVRWSSLRKDGDYIPANEIVGELEGNARDLLSLERTILNFLQRCSGIATQARHFKELLGAREKPVLLDTRKTIPGWRYLDKRAVVDGGLRNHRFALDSGILIKENHIRSAGSITNAVKSLRAQIPHSLRIQVEVTSLDEAYEAIEAGAELLLLDNFTVTELHKVVPQIRSRAAQVQLEVSGGVDESNLLAYAAAGVDFISMGCLTHSVKAANLSMLFENNC